jgi:carbonic anhydrase
MWGYKENNGPSHWLSVALNAAGYNQSPVVIERAHAQFDPKLKEKKLEPIYSSAAAKSLSNNGHSATVSIDGAESRLTGGPLATDYTLKQFHFHWGSKSGSGSEHMIDDKTYSAELHFVHWNSAKYAAFEDALKEADGLAVLTVFLEKSKTDHDHLGMKVITDLLPSVCHSGDKTPMPAGFDPTTLLPDERTRYWTYHGSLTTPPCYESVQFIIYEKPIEVSEKQLEAFRSLNTCSRDSCPSGKHDDQADCCKMVDNFRPTMPLNGRVISATFNSSDINDNV